MAKAETPFAMAQTPELNFRPFYDANTATFNYADFWAAELKKKHDDKTYRYFTNVNRLASHFPQAKTPGKNELITIWCANDYLGMSHNAEVLKATHDAIDLLGTGSGGSRNLSGHGQLIEDLEKTVARLHGKESGLVFSSCHVAVENALAVLSKKLPDCVHLSDQDNHSCIIQGISHSRSKKMIWAHNDMQDLEAKLSTLPPETPKIISFESVYSMDGSVAPIEAICDLAEKYGAITFLDEVHAVGMYGPHGEGVAAHLDYDAHKIGDGKRTVMDRVDIICATFGKAYGCYGGYMTGKADVVDMVRSHAPGTAHMMPHCSIPF